MRPIDGDDLLLEVMGIHDGWLQPPKKWTTVEDSIRMAPTITGKTGLDLETENKILWHILEIADECGIDFNFEDEMDEFADEMQDMSYWQRIIFCAGLQLHLFGDNLCQMKPYIDSLKKM